MVVQDSCWALSYMTDGPDEQIELALQAGVLARVVQLLEVEENSMIAPALRVLGNFVTGNDVLTQVTILLPQNYGCIRGIRGFWSRGR